MRFGLRLPSFALGEDTASLAEMGAYLRHAEDLGFESAMLIDHLLVAPPAYRTTWLEPVSLLSALSGLPLKQGIAVTGAVNQHGEILPVGGINEKIEGWFRVCEHAGLDGSHGVLIPSRNRRHLMLAPQVVEAVAAGRFHIHVAEYATEGMERLTGVATGELNAAGHYPHDSVLGHAQEALLAFRRACQSQEHPKTPRRHFRAGESPRRR